MIGIGWATLYATIVEKYELDSKFKMSSQSQSQCCNNINK